MIQQAQKVPLIAVKRVRKTIQGFLLLNVSELPQQPINLHRNYLGM